MKTRNSKTPQKTLLPVKVGDKLRDCDPRIHGADKAIIVVEKDYVTVTSASNRKTTIRRNRIHDNANRKSGYYWVRA